jgi:hypothetical protein
MTAESDGVQRKDEISLDPLSFMLNPPVQPIPNSFTKALKCYFLLVLLVSRFYLEMLLLEALPPVEEEAEPPRWRAQTGAWARDRCFTQVWSSRGLL